MATFYKVGDVWRAQVARRGIRKSQSGFATKAAAVAWAGRVESEIMSGARGETSSLLFRDILDRYAKERSPKKKGGRWEVIRLKALGSDKIASVSLKRLDRAHVADWRDRRLEAVSEASVRREWNTLSHVCAVAVREWRLLHSNPFRELPRPKSAQPRTRIVTEAELAKLLTAASPNMGRIIRFALETGMRAGEIAKLKPEDIRGAVATLNDTKNGTRREVPLSKAALEQLPAPFGLATGSISALFARLCAECKITGLTFHDLRRSAIVRLAKKLPPMELAKMVGHKDLKMTLNTYYQIDAEDIAKRLG